MRRFFGHVELVLSRVCITWSYFITNWVLSTNHKRISVMYFLFIICTSFTGLALATVVRIELAVPGVSFLDNNSEKYLTVAALHAIVMVFFVVIPLLFGAFGNFLLPTQLGVRDVAFPRLNSFMFWITPSGFVMLMHILLFDKEPQNVTKEVSFVRKAMVDQLVHFDAFVTSFAVADQAERESWDEGLLDRQQTAKSFLSGTFLSDFVYGSVYDAFWFVCDVLWIFMRDVMDFEVVQAVGDFLVENGLIMPEYTFPMERMGRLWKRVIRNIVRELKVEYLGEYAHASREFSVNSEVRRSLNGVDGILLPRQTDSADFSIAEVLMANDKFQTFEAVRSLFPKTSTSMANQIIPGWAFITPYTSRLRFSGVGKVDIALIVIFMAGLGSVFSAVNYVITYRCVSAPSFKNRREMRSFFVDALLVGSRMMLAANPALLIAILFLLSDRHLGTSIFDFSGGGDAVLFQHLFWFFGHPEVYIIIIPCFGIVNSLLPHLLRKRLSGRLSLQFSMYTIGFMGFAVWGHHMYMVGLANTTRTLYSTMTVMISVPASTKVLHWCVTLINSAPQFDISLLFLLSFSYFFTLGGLSGMFNAHIGFDVSLHDTFFVIGHFHVMLSGAALSCIFAAFYFYFGAIFGVTYSRFWALLHFIFYFSGQLLTLIPMFWLGYSGMPRRIMDYPAYFGGWHSIISGGHFLSVLSFICFLVMLIDSYWEGDTNPSRTLGVSRLNTRLAFYSYERKKLSRQKRSKMGHTQSSAEDLQRSLAQREIELRNIFY